MISPVLSVILHRVVPFFSVLLLIFLAVGPLSGLGRDSHFMIISAMIYGWVLYYPGCLPLFLLLVLGIFFDGLGAGMMGLTSLIWVVMGWVVRDHHHWLRFGTLWSDWIVFAFFMVILACMNGGLGCLLTLSLLPLQGLIWGWVTVCFAFPLIVAGVEMMYDGLEPTG